MKGGIRDELLVANVDTHHVTLGVVLERSDRLAGKGLSERGRAAQRPYGRERSAGRSVKGSTWQSGQSHLLLRERAITFFLPVHGRRNRGLCAGRTSTDLLAFPGPSGDQKSRA